MSLTEDAETAETTLRVCTLGRFRALDHTQELHLGGRQQRAVLAILVTHDGADVSLGRIAEGLWGEHVPRGYQQTLQTYISHLRAALNSARALLVTNANGYALRLQTSQVDATVFRRETEAGVELLDAGSYDDARARLSAALSLWDGEVLADLAEFPFVESYADPLDQLRLTALEALLHARLELGEHEGVAIDAESLIAEHPLRERAYLLRMLALYRAGRQADALATYHRLRTVLDEELGVEPGPDAQELQQAILRQDPQLRPPPRASARTTGGQDREQKHPPHRRRRVLLGAIAAVAVVAGSLAVYGTTHWHNDTLSAVPANAVALLASDGTLRDAVPIGAPPTALAYGAGSLWVASSTQDRVYRIDPKHRSVQPIAVGGSPVSIAVTDRDAWVVNSADGTVSRISTKTDTLVGAPISVGVLPRAIAVGPSGVWVANVSDATVQRINPTTDTVDLTVDVGGASSALAVTPHAVYVADEQQRTVTQLDPRTGERIGAAITTGSGPSALAVTPGSLWVVNAGDQTVERIGLTTGAVSATIPVGDGADGIAVHGGRIWVSTQYDGTVSEIDATTNTLVHRRSIGALPTALAAGSNGVWTAAGALDQSVHIGGTLRVLDSYLPGHISLDPSSMYEQSRTYWAFHLVYDGLVSFQYSQGANGLSVVPDLATSLPQPSDGGKTYAFTVRPGVLFSTGVELTASDIKRGVFRDLTIDPGWAGSSRILGASACVARPKRCNIDKGVVVDDTMRSIVFHLSEPDPEFLNKLTYFGMAVAPGAPATEAKSPLPGTGPYEIASYSKDGVLALTRNPHFRQWSFAAQPGAYADRIQFSTQSTTEQRLRAVEDGRGDVVTLIENDDAAPVAQFARNYPAQFVQFFAPGVQFWLFNTSQPPFNDVRVRQAVNYAIDRNRIVDILGGSAFASVTCQMLPPHFPAWRPYCPYSAGGTNATYSGPDPQKATRLIAQARVRGALVTLIGSSSGNADERVTAYLASVLKNLGLKVRFAKPYTDNTSIFNTIQNGEHWQFVYAPNWYADYPGASDFYFSLVSCHQFFGALTSNQLYCNKALDAAAHRALDAQSSDPAAARTQWQQIDHNVTDAAPAAFLYNPIRSVFVSARVRNLQTSPQWGPLLSQIWVK
jgi:ABC-type transport system substrate-binding protein/DNA-binding SARP family transcriptional activator/streptogramin lyase